MPVPCWLTVPQRVDHQRNIFRVCIRGDPVAEVEDVRAFAEGLADAQHFINQRLTPCDHMAGGKVALDTTVHLNMFGRPFCRNGIVDGNAIGPRRLGETDIAVARLAREGNDRNVGVAGLERGDDLFGGL